MSPKRTETVSVLKVSVLKGLRQESRAGRGEGGERERQTERDRETERQRDREGEEGREGGRGRDWRAGQF